MGKIQCLQLDIFSSIKIELLSDPKDIEGLIPHTCQTNDIICIQLQDLTLILCFARLHLEGVHGGGVYMLPFLLQLVHLFLCIMGCRLVILYLF